MNSTLFNKLTPFRAFLMVLPTAIRTGQRLNRASREIALKDSALPQRKCKIKYFLKVLISHMYSLN